MGRFLNPDNSAFQAALNANIYVDKSEMIDYTNRVLGSIDAFICNSRPRRFGKSITANMLAAYGDILPEAIKSLPEALSHINAAKGIKYAVLF